MKPLREYLGSTPRSVRRDSRWSKPKLEEGSGQVDVSVQRLGSRMRHHNGENGAVGVWPLRLCS